MRQEMVDIVMQVAAKYFPVNSLTRVYDIPEKHTNWTVAREVPIHMDRFSPGKNLPDSIVTFEETIKITHALHLIFGNKFFRYGFGGRTNSLIIQESAPSAYDKSDGIIIDIED